MTTTSRQHPPSRRPAFIDRVPVGRRVIMLAAMLAWIGLLLYPDPRVLLNSIRRLINPPVNESAVGGIAPTLPDDAAAVEAYSQSQVRYESAWKLYGVPWYFPTVDEVLRDKAGDCQAEAVLTASILQAKGLPYTFRYSFDHVWVDYPGKQVTSLLEDPSTAFVSDEGKGWFASLPDRIPLRAIVRERVSYHWDPMPPTRKAGLFAGMVLMLLVGERLIAPLLRPAARFREQTQEG
ncbi:MAG: transglutaminase domain-containing protein [Actinobacteria bacterium]|nr:transglutaminase domain-containing protein [Actinomycetota bacterium]